ncbi:hypothetical protein Tco_1369594 [Tanacetum coccineum]
MELRFGRGTPEQNLGKNLCWKMTKWKHTTNPRRRRTNAKGKVTQNVEFYQHPFVFKEPNRDTRDLMASPFTNRIRDYDMPDRLKVPTNLKTYDGMSDPDDHLTVFMRIMDVHKLPKPVWCRIFPITLLSSLFGLKTRTGDTIDGLFTIAR